MTIQLTLIGLGQIGSSIGLALADHADKFTITGTDIDGKVMQESHKKGAVSKTTSNINQAVKNADVVILSLPLDQVLEMVDMIAPTIKAGAILLETAPIKGDVVKRVKDCLPESCSYVGLTPVLNHIYIHNEGYGIATAQANLFHDGMFGIITPPQSNAQAVNFATDFVQLLGASPLFIDLQENDGLMTATHLLPQLLSIALLNATIDHPGWGEARKWQVAHLRKSPDLLPISMRLKHSNLVRFSTRRTLYAKSMMLLEFFRNSSSKLQIMTMKP